MAMRFLVAWEDAKTGQINTSRISFAAKELAEETARTLARFQPDREYWVLRQEDAAVASLAAPGRHRAIKVEHKRSMRVPGDPLPAGVTARKSATLSTSLHADLGWRPMPILSPDRLPVSPRN
jgi:hypothetical protein